MITLTVKTLDAQNHSFDVEDDITVEQFKARIAETVNVPAETQRIIYCGRVLQDGTKLSDHNVNGKVVHLVQRPPPGTSARPSNRTASPPPTTTRRVFMEPGNAMYLGSMPFPTNFMDSQTFVPPPPTHSLAGSRLNVARRMLRRAEAVIRVLENPSARPSDQTPPEEPQEEVTPVIEARVIVPSSSNEPIDEAMVLSAVHDSLLNATGTTDGNEDTPTEPRLSDSQGQSVSSTPETVTPTRSSTENLAASGEQRQENNSTGNTFPENASRTSEMAELLTMLNNLQLRFAPFLERYHNFMTEDPVVAPEDVRQMQAMLTRVSGVLHFLGHAYHSLSDIIIRVRTPPPRPLLCRPILIQHSAVVQAGIPIQVEAQINLSTDRPGAQSESGNNNNANAASGADSNAPSAPPSTTQESTQPSNTTSSNAAQILSNQMMSFPFLPGTSMHVQYRSLPHTTGAHSSRNNNNNGAAAAAASTGAAASSMAAPTTATAASADTETSRISQPAQSAESAPVSERTDTADTTPRRNGAAGNAFDIFHTPNVEFFMEVTPEVMRGSMNAPPPELLQSLMQVAGQIIGRTTAASTTVNSTPLRTPASAPSDSTPNENQPQSELLQSIVQMANQMIGPQANVIVTSSTPQTTADGSQSAAAAASQNSQARVNTQTNPTTATHTRSTARPHVHLAQQAMQGGFDPFLPCNSHHLPPRRRFQVTSSSSHNANRDEVRNPTGNTQSSTPQNPPNRLGQLNYMNLIVEDFVNSLRSRNAQSGAARPQSAPPTGAANSNSSNAANSNSSNAASAPRNDSAASNPDSPQTGGSNLANLLRTIEMMQQHMDTSVSTASNVPSANAASTNPPNASAEEGIMSHIQSLIESHGISRDSNVRLSEMIRLLVHYDATNRSVISDLISLLADNLSINDLVLLYTGNLMPFNRLRNQVASFVNRRVLANSTGPATVDRGVELLLTELRPFLEHFRALPVNDGIDMVRSAEALFRNRLPNIISIASNLGQNNNMNQIRLLFDQCSTTLSQLCALIVHCSTNGAGVENFLNQIACQWIRGTPDFQAQLRQYLNNLSVPTSILQPYIVHRSDTRIPIAVNGTSDVVNLPQTHTPMEVDDQEANGPVSDASSGASSAVDEDTEPLPNVVIGSESWHNQLPSDWVPIITRDIQRQRRQSPQRSFSDAYLSGMPNKRRKLINGNKPQGTLSEVISDSVRRAVTATGLTTVAPLETVAQAAGSSAEVQTAYRSLLKTSVQDKLKNDKDFTPDRFPNSSNYFNKN